jgi:hypothetical protein
MDKFHYRRMLTPVWAFIICVFLVTFFAVNRKQAKKRNNQFNQLQATIQSLGKLKKMKVGSFEYSGAQAQNIFHTFRIRQPHHSGPLNRVPAILEGTSGSLKLTLGRDSKVANEYWVFYQDPQSEAGSVYTDIPLGYHPGRD